MIIEGPLRKPLSVIGHVGPVHDGREGLPLPRVQPRGKLGDLVHPLGRRVQGLQVLTFGAGASEHLVPVAHVLHVGHAHQVLAHLAALVLVQRDQAQPHAGPGTPRGGGVHRHPFGEEPLLCGERRQGVAQVFHVLLLDVEDALGHGLDDFVEQGASAGGIVRPLGGRQGRRIGAKVSGAGQTGQDQGEDAGLEIDRGGPHHAA
mmetsp:Transcript_39861/g.93458  ORF Transcript_39861/g.93458 Transcript_39861/m.93458 type:complete len:204 (+) Transcript_39861:618-1229(+)